MHQKTVRRCTGTAASAIAVIGLLHTVASQAHAQILNPSFEQPVVSGAGDIAFFSTGDTIGSGWVVQSTSTSVAVLDNAFTGGGVVWHPAPDGDQYLYLSTSVGDSTLRQDVALDALSYRLQFDQADFATAFSTPGGQVTVDVVDANTLLSVLGSPQVFTTPDFSDYVTRTIDFTAPTAATYRLLLTSTAGRAGLVDNFRLNVQGAAGAPEPASLALLALPALALIARRRRTDAL